MTQKAIDHPSKLAGERIAIGNFGGSNELAVVLALKEWGIPRQSVTLIRSGDTAGRLIALANRNLDATLLSMPYTVEAQKLGLNILAHLVDMQAAFPMTVVAVNRSFFAEETEHSKAVHGGLQRGDLPLDAIQRDRHRHL